MHGTTAEREAAPAQPEEWARIIAMSEAAADISATPLHRGREEVDSPHDATTEGAAASHAPQGGRPFSLDTLDEEAWEDFPHAAPPRVPTTYHAAL